ncbi:MAG TPA: multiubiquitin domain-containing protein [Fermentimonas sp.]|nr:multiubiquitin domain-containing protein [Fermentimonas sp.]
MVQNIPNKPDDIPGKKDVNIVVNGVQKVWNKREISFREVIVLAFGEFIDSKMMCYTVTYKRGSRQKPEGSMVDGDSVNINPNMIFNVTATDKS